jgi:hypothetical protein
MKMIHAFFFPCREDKKRRGEKNYKEKMEIFLSFVLLR